jgi:hypothetical protein
VHQLAPDQVAGDVQDRAVVERRGERLH